MANQIRTEYLDKEAMNFLIEQQEGCLEGFYPEIRSGMSIYVMDEDGRKVLVKVTDIHKHELMELGRTFETMLIYGLKPIKGK